MTAARYVRSYRPVHTDLDQMDAYRLVSIRVYSDGTLRAVFADGHDAPSVYASEAQLLAAVQRSWLERVVLDTDDSGDEPYRPEGAALYDGTPGSGSIRKR